MKQLSLIPLICLLISCSGSPGPVVPAFDSLTAARFPLFGEGVVGNVWAVELHGREFQGDSVWSWQVHDNGAKFVLGEGDALRLWVDGRVWYPFYRPCGLQIEGETVECDTVNPVMYWDPRPILDLDGSDVPVVVEGGESSDVEGFSTSLREPEGEVRILGIEAGDRVHRDAFDLRWEPGTADTAVIVLAAYIDGKYSLRRENSFAVPNTGSYRVTASDFSELPPGVGSITVYGLNGSLHISEERGEPVALFLGSGEYVKVLFE